MVDRQERNIEGERKRLGGTNADQQGADQTRGVMNGDGADLADFDPRLPQRLINHRQQLT